MVWDDQPPAPMDCPATVATPGLAQPTAVHAEPVQDTSYRTPANTLWATQLVPVQVSTNAPCLTVQDGVRKQLQVGWPLLQRIPSQCPTTTQLFPLGHETPYSVVEIRAPGSEGAAIVWSAQLVPFQRSARLLPESIAVHAAAAEQDTRDSAGPVGPPAAGTAQTLPFQTSASACCVPELST
jgi:hypothetical protein